MRNTLKILVKNPQEECGSYRLEGNIKMNIV